MNLTPTEIAEICECHPEGKCDCYCDNTHHQNNTVCVYCYHVGLCRCGHLRTDHRPQTDHFSSTCRECSCREFDLDQPGRG
jgi:hypothetical protein